MCMRAGHPPLGSPGPWPLHASRPREGRLPRAHDVSARASSGRSSGPVASPARASVGAAPPRERATGSAAGAGRAGSATKGSHP